MIGNQKIIGVCLTKINQRVRADFVTRLHMEATKRNYKLMVFNSVKDFYNDDAYDEGAKSIYNVINYDILDALIVFSETFYNVEILNAIINKAKTYNIPVISIGTVVDGCYSIVKEYTDAYKSLIRHIIKDHGITDTYFVAGLCSNDPESQVRLQCYKDVLNECGLPFSEEQVGYGEYWAVPTRALFTKKFEDGQQPPRAIICANDSMAMTVCECLQEHGYNIPDDVMVTGFDGIPEAEFFTPKITTCKENHDHLANLSLELITDALNGTVSWGIFKEQYVPFFTQSCGCKEETSYYRNDSNYLFHMVQEIEQHEAHMYSWIDQLIEGTDINQMVPILSKCILPNSFICLSTDFITSITKFSMMQDCETLSNELAVIAYGNSEESLETLPRFNLEDMAPNLESWLKDDTSYIFTSLFVGSDVCGYYAAPINGVYDYAHKVNRIAKTVNIAFNSIISQIKQNFMKQSMENASLSNSITKLPNLKGVTKWFNDFSAVWENHEKALAVSLYSLPKYKYIYENYGIKDIEEVLCVVSDALVLANPKDCMVAHISEDEFIILNYFEDGSQISDTINSATSIFFTTIESYNNHSGKEYYVEVNCGCTVVNPGWDGMLSNFIKLASNEMYVNRIKSGMGAAIKEKSSAKDHYNAFNILVEKNLFDYHFQPIVNAKNGEIYAYEALMRPDASIGMNPLQVLETASVYKRLYDIERATMFNVMERFARDFEKFSGHKVFINSIPGYFLNDNDNRLIGEKYSDYMKYFIFEITEQNSISDEELSAIKRIGNTAGNNPIAVDDYGTGHSNIVNLLRYAPQIVKIDRFLITDIHKDVNKQMFVRSTIEFARMNNIQVLAEGVETSDELRTVIDFGVDYVQGYYTGRPAPDPIPCIAEDIRNEILKANPLFANTN